MIGIVGQGKVSTTRGPGINSLALEDSEDRRGYVSRNNTGGSSDFLMKISLAGEHSRELRIEIRTRAT